MYKILMIALFSSIVLYSCDPAYSTKYQVVNDTQQDAEIFFYSSNSNMPETVGGVYYYKQDTSQSRDLDANSSLLLFAVDEDLSGSPAELSFTEDSIIVKFNNEQIIKFYPDSTSLSSGKNIYNVETNWEGQNKKNNYTFTFRITEEDLADAQ